MRQRARAPSIVRIRIPAINCLRPEPLMRCNVLLRLPQSWHVTQATSIDASTCSKASRACAQATTSFSRSTNIYSFFSWGHWTSKATKDRACNVTFKLPSASAHIRACAIRCMCRYASFACVCPDCERHTSCRMGLRSKSPS